MENLDDLAWTFENPEKQKNQQVRIYYFSLTTCPHCKKGIKWLLDRDVAFKWLYLDKIALDEKNSVKKWIQETYNLPTRMGTPFVIFRLKQGEYFSNGYDPEYWSSKIR
ncbi:MAG: hypothetical protein ACTSWX_08725 [Promethearchaeota archaeon]